MTLTVALPCADAVILQTAHCPGDPLPEGTVGGVLLELKVPKVKSHHVVLPWGVTWKGEGSQGPVQVLGPPLCT